MSASNSPLLPEEWDFRSIEGRLLPTVIEYEYLRSSDLARPIKRWLAQPYERTSLARHVLSVPTLRAANLITVPARSPLLKIEKYLEHDISAGWQPPPDFAAAERQIRAARVFSGTVGEAIGLLYKRIENLAAIESALMTLAESLPPAIRNRRAERICLRFDRFPEPWLRIAASPGGMDYLERRTQSSPPKGEALWDVINPLDYAALVEAEPLIHYHQFIIDWSRRRNEILADFRKWLDRAHPDSRPGIRRKEGWLKSLSAYRLTRIAGMTYAKAMEVVADWKDYHPGAASDTLPNAQSDSDWSRYVSEVERTLNGDFIREIRDSFNDLSANTPPNQPHVPGAIFVRSLVPYEKTGATKNTVDKRQKK